MSGESEGRREASKFRREHNLGSAPLGDLVTLIEQAVGADVAVLDTEPNQHGMTMRRGNGGSVYIAVTRTPHPMRQRSTLAHELAHVVFGDWSAEAIIDSTNPVEIRANSFARHLLIPQEGLEEMIDGKRIGQGRALLSATVQRFLVSPSIAAIALKQCGHIDKATKDDWMSVTTPALAAQFGWMERYQALAQESNRRRAPQRLLARAISGWLQNLVPIQTIATLRGLSAVEAEEELRREGLRPADMNVAPSWSDASELPEVSIDLAEFDADMNDSLGK